MRGNITNWKLDFLVVLCLFFNEGMGRKMKSKRMWSLLYLLVALFVFSVGASFTCAQPMEEEEEELMPYPNPLERNSKTLNFLRNKFGSFSIKAMNALKAGKTVKMTAKKSFKLGSSFSARKGAKLLVGTTKTGLKIRSMKKGDRGVLLRNKPGNNGMTIHKLASTSPKGMMHKGAAMKKGMMH